MAHETRRRDGSNGRLRALALAATGLWLAACGGGGGGGKPKPPPSAVTVLSASTCPSGPGGLPGSTCQLLEIQAGSNQAMQVEVRVFEPDPAAAYLGTAVLSSGSSGIGFYGDITGGDQLIADLVAQGLRVVDRRWETTWLQAGDTILASSEGYAELLRWIHDNLHAGGLFAVTGQSGGSSEIAYGLGSWGLEQLIDVAVLSSGPSMARLDFQCFPPSPTWAALCPAIVPPGKLTCGVPLCTASQHSFLCSLHAPGKTPLELEAMSVLHPGAELNNTGTLIHVIVGDGDCTTSLPQALYYQQALLGPSTLTWVAGADHNMPGTAQGRAAIVSALLGYAPAEHLPGPTVRLQLTVTDGERAATRVQTWR